MTKDEITALVRGFLEKTRRNEVAWTQSSAAGLGDFWTALYPDHIVLQLPKSLVMVRRERLSKRGITISLSNDERKPVVEYTAADDDPLYAMLTEMLDLALERIRKVDQTIHDVQDFLKKKPG